MTVTTSIYIARLIEERLSQAPPDLLRELLTLFNITRMSAVADADCGAAYDKANPERTNRRNGYRGRGLDTRRRVGAGSPQAERGHALPGVAA